MFFKDFNVPLDGSAITNNQRIVAALPSIKYAKEKGMLLKNISNDNRIT